MNWLTELWEEAKRNPEDAVSAFCVFIICGYLLFIILFLGWFIWVGTATWISAENTVNWELARFLFVYAIRGLIPAFLSLWIFSTINGYN